MLRTTSEMSSGRANYHTRALRHVREHLTILKRRRRLQRYLVMVRLL